MFMENKRDAVNKEDENMMSGGRKPTILKGVSLIFTLLCAVAVGACLIADVAEHGAVTWAGYVSCAVPFLWIIAAPLLCAKKHKVIFTLTAISAATILFLYLIDLQTPAKSWFSTIGLTAAITFILSLWGAAALIRFLRINKWYLAAGITAVFGIIINSAVLYSIGIYRDAILNPVYNIAITFGIVVISFAIAILGYILNNRKALGKETVSTMIEDANA